MIYTMVNCDLIRSKKYTYGLCVTKAGCLPAKKTLATGRWTFLLSLISRNCSNSKVSLTRKVCLGVPTKNTTVTFLGRSMPAPRCGRRTPNAAPGFSHPEKGSDPSRCRETLISTEVADQMPLTFAHYPRLFERPWIRH